MNDTRPPDYSSQDTNLDSSILLNLTPHHDSTTFQFGYLGHGKAYVAGDVQIKYARTEPIKVDRLVIKFKGVERTSVDREPIVLCEQHQVLWGTGAQGSSSSGAATTTDDSRQSLPTNSPFKLEITPDLPVCLHLGNSSALEYTLTAELHFSDSNLRPLVRCAPVHLTRNSPSTLLLSPSSVTKTSSPTSPIDFSVKLPRTTFRSNEPIELRVKVKVPSAEAVRKGLRLRTVSAELVRKITVKSASSSTTAKRNLEGTGESESKQSDSEEVEEVEENGEVEGSREEQHEHRTVLAHSGKSARFSPTRPIIIKLVLHPATEIACESITQSTILHSVSFHVNVTIGLFNLGSASTLHSGSSLAPHSSTIASSSTSSSTTPTSLDATLSQEVIIIPDAVPSIDVMSAAGENDQNLIDSSNSTNEVSAVGEGKRSVEGSFRLLDDAQFGEGHLRPPPDAATGELLHEHSQSLGESDHIEEGPVPTYVESRADDPGVPALVEGGPENAVESTSSMGFPPRITDPMSSMEEPFLFEWVRRDGRMMDDGGEEEEEDEEEYDGYEEMSIPVEAEGPPPPAIDEDVSPPSANDPGSSTPTTNNFLNGEFLTTSTIDHRSESPSPPSSPPPPLSPLSTTFPRQANDNAAPPLQGLPPSLGPTTTSTPPPRLNHTHTPNSDSDSLLPPPVLLDTPEEESLPPPYIIGSSSLPDPPPHPAHSSGSTSSSSISCQPLTSSHFPLDNKTPTIPIPPPQSRIVGSTSTSSQQGNVRNHYAPSTTGSPTFVEDSSRRPPLQSSTRGNDFTNEIGHENERNQSNHNGDNNVEVDDRSRINEGHDVSSLARRTEEDRDEGEREAQEEEEGTSRDPPPYSLDR